MYCLVVWLFALAIGLAHACSMLPAAHALGAPDATASAGDADGDEDEGIGCNKSCTNGVPPCDNAPSLDRFLGAPAIIVQSRVEIALPSITVRSRDTMSFGIYYSGTPPRLPFLRLTI